MSAASQEIPPSINIPLAVIVEDDRDIVDLFRQILEIVGYRTAIVQDGLDAMKLISETLPDIVLLDLQLPGMSGVEILNRMRGSDSMLNIPVVVITAYSHLRQTLVAEPDLLLQKPININPLTRLLQRIMDAKNGVSQPALDPLTGVFDVSFFRVRLIFSLERIKQNMLKRSALLFADVLQWEEIKSELSGQDLNDFQYGLMVQFKNTLRPTDTMAWSAENGCFLTLLEDVSSETIPLKRAKRLAADMRKYSGPYNSGMSLRINVGVLIFDAEYEDIQAIMKDVAQACHLLRNKQYASLAVFDREMLYARR